MSGIGHDGALDGYRIYGVVQFRQFVEGEVEGRQDEIVHQHMFPPFDNAAPQDFYAVLPVALSPPEYERAGYAAVFVGYEFQPLELVAPGVLQDRGHFFSGLIGLDGVTSAVQDCLEEHGLVGLEGRTIGEDDALLATVTGMLILPPRVSLP